MIDISPTTQCAYFAAKVPAFGATAILLRSCDGFMLFRMKRRIYYAARPGYSPMKYVLLVHPAGEEEVTLYCPPGVAGGPWVESFPTVSQAMDLASNLAREIGQLHVKTTDTKVDWLLNGLELIGDSDARDR